MVRDAVRIHEHDVWCGCMRGVVVYQALPQRAADMLIEPHLERAGQGVGAAVHCFLRTGGSCSEFAVVQKLKALLRRELMKARPNFYGCTFISDICLANGILD